MNSVTIIGNFHDIWKRDALGNILAVGERGRANPVSVIEDIKQRQTTNRLIASLGLKLRPINGLTVDYTMGIDNYSQNGTTYIPPFAYNVSTAFLVVVQHLIQHRMVMQVRVTIVSLPLTTI